MQTFPYKTRMICDDTPKLDIRKIKATLPEVFEIEGERIVTTWTAAGFGGRRQWLLCPSCDRRCAVIYRPEGRRLFCCRVCGDGRYRSELLSPKHRRIKKAHALRRKMGQTEGGLGCPMPLKPDGMHWTRYTRLRAAATELEAQVWEDAEQAAWWRRIKAATCKD